MPGSLQLGMIIYYKIEKTFVPSPNTARGQPSLLDISPKGDFLLYANDKAIVMRSLTVSEISLLFDRKLLKVRFIMNIKSQ